MRVIKLTDVFALDPRGLALLRIGLGVLLLLKVAFLLPEAGLWLGVDGLVPPELLTRKIPYWSWLLPYDWTTQTWQIVALLTLHMAIAGAFALGWRTRWMTPLLWWMTISLNARNPMILNGGDKVLTALLFCAIFLPLGRYLSLDARREGDRALTPFASGCAAFGSTLLILQVVAIYFLSGVAKYHPVWGVEYQAVLLALQDDSHTTALGRHLCQYPEMLQIITFATIYLEQFFILLLLSPFYNQPLRLVLGLIFIGMHVGIALTLNIGLFAYACIVMWLAVLPPMAYDWIWSRLKALPPPPSIPSLHRRPVMGGMACMALLVALTIQPKGSTLHTLAEPMRALNLHQKWNMYAPLPTTATRWFALEAVNQEGLRLCLYPLRETEFGPDTSRMRCNTYTSYLMCKFFRDLSKKKNTAFFHAAYEALLRHWNPVLATTAAGFELVEWRKTLYPATAKEFTRVVIYSSLRSASTEMAEGPADKEEAKN